MSDPPHLLKTTRNCLYNPRQRLEVKKIMVTKHMYYLFCYVQCRSTTNNFPGSLYLIYILKQIKQQQIYVRSTS